MRPTNRFSRVSPLKVSLIYRADEPEERICPPPKAAKVIFAHRGERGGVGYYQRGALMDVVLSRSASLSTAAASLPRPALIRSRLMELVHRKKANTPLVSHLRGPPRPTPDQSGQLARASTVDMGAPANPPPPCIFTSSRTMQRQRMLETRLRL